jgi:hypothetical protein
VYEVENIVLQEEGQQQQQQQQQQTKKRFFDRCLPKKNNNNKVSIESTFIKQDDGPLEEVTDGRSFMKLHCRRYSISNEEEDGDGSEDNNNSERGSGKEISTNKVVKKKNSKQTSRGQLHHQRSLLCGTYQKKKDKQGLARYAIKVIRPEIMDDPTKLYYQGNVTDFI